MFDLKAAGHVDPILVAATDGVGTKLELAKAMGQHRGLGVDLVAMCANDVLAQGALPLFFLDYFATGKLDPGVAAEVVAGIADGCLEAGCALIGGETAEMPGIYPPGGYDLAGFCIGAFERGQHIDPARTNRGDIAIALQSDGCHANGFSLIRKVIERAGADIEKPAPFDDTLTLGTALLQPTRLYIKTIDAIARSLGSMTAIHGLAHITGGGLVENPPRAFGSDLSLQMDLSSYELPSVFRWLKEEGHIEATEMARVFNCGIGMVIYVDPADGDRVIEAAENTGCSAWVVGSLATRDGDDAVVLNGIDNWG